MRIDKIEIDGFGKLNNCSYTFADGVNLIYGENESGKSTLCEFILSAFYGLPNESKKVTDDLPARKKYRPWSGDAFGGRVYFTDDAGRKLVIERSFKATKRSDKAVLRDADTWEELGNGEDLGEKCFGLSREAFLKTLYVKSFGADSLKNDDGEILSRLSNLETSGDEDVSYSKIINSMEKEIFSLKTKTGKGGKIPALTDKVMSLKQELTLSAIAYSTLSADEETARNLKTAAQDKEKEAKELEEKYACALQHEKFVARQKVEETKAIIQNRLKSEKEKSENIKQQLENLDAGEEPVISAEEINRARALETKKLLAEEKMLEAKNQIPYEERPPILNDNRVIPAFFGLVILLLGILLKSNVLFVAGILVADLGILICLLINLKRRKDYDKKTDLYYEAKYEYDKINKDLHDIFETYGILVSDELSALFTASSNKADRLLQLQKQYAECEEEIKKLTNSIPQETEQEAYSREVIEYEGESADVIFTKINMLKSESRQMSERANELSLKIARETAEIRKEADILAELDGVNQELADLEKKYNSLVKAAEWLEAAHNEIKNNFAPRLNRKTSEMLTFLTSDKYADVRSNDTFGINLKTAGGEIVEAGFMSRGTYDLLYIALRFAAMSVITCGNIPPVILDDAFSQLDDSRLQRAVDLITESGEFSQVLLFTCHKNYKELLKDSKINVTEL